MSERETRPWRFPDEWWFGDPGADIEDAIELEFEFAELGTHHVVVHARGVKFDDIYAKIADGAVDYVLANPQFYGLTKRTD